MDTAEEQIYYNFLISIGVLLTKLEAPADILMECVPPKYATAISDCVYLGWWDLNIF